MNSARAVALAALLACQLGCGGDEECSERTGPGIVEGRYWAPLGVGSGVRIGGRVVEDVLFVRVDAVAGIVFVEVQTPDGIAVLRYRIEGG